MERIQRRLFDDIGPNGMLLSQGTTNREDMGNLALFDSRQAVAARRQRQSFDAQIFGVGARSPQERAEAARRTAATQYDDSETVTQRKVRIEQAGSLARAQAEEQLKDAQEQRIRSLDASVEAQQLELSLIGKTVGEVERLRTTYQLEAQLREEAARNNIAVDETELKLIREKAAELGKLADLRARAGFMADAQFDRDQLGRNPSERQVASQLRSTFGKADMNSYEAGILRANEALRQQVSVWEDIRDTGRDAIDDVVESASNGFDDIDDVLKNIGKDLTKQLLTLGVSNPLKNGIYGDNLPTIETAGGIGGFFSSLLGGKSPASDGFTASMSVNAGTVMINGGLTAGSASPFDSLLGRAANNNQPGGYSGLTNYAQAIKSIESSGNYGALGPITKTGDRALGAYQMMGANIPSWSKAALGRSLSTDEFLKNPALQDQIFNHRFGGYVGQFGPSGAAQAWFGGPGSVGRGGNWADQLGTTGTAYVQKFNQALGNVTTSTNTAAGGLGNLGAGFDQFGKTLSGMGAGGGSSGGGLFGWLSNLFGGSSLNSALSASPQFASAWASGGIGLYADGGLIAGPGTGRSDSIMARVSNGEFIVNAMATSRHRPVLEAINSNRMPAFADGGYYGSPSVYANAAQGRDSFSGAPARNAPIINNYGSSSVEYEETTDQHGNRQPVVTIGEMAAGAVRQRGNPLRRAIQSEFGSSPRKIAR